MLKYKIINCSNSNKSDIKLCYEGDTLVDIVGCKILYTILKPLDVVLQNGAHLFDYTTDCLENLLSSVFLIYNIKNDEITTTDRIMSLFNSFFNAIQISEIDILRVVQPRDCNTSANVITTNFEMFFSLIFFYYIFQTTRSTHVINVLFFDMPPGFGKTHVLNMFSKILTNSNNPCVICTPTAQSCSLYTNVVACTLHSKFRIPFNKYETKDTFNIKYCAAINNIARLIVNDVYIFDEFSMISAEILTSLIKAVALKNKFCIIIGDSCQLKPVCGKLINLDTPCEFNKHILRFCAAETPQLVRFARDVNFSKFILHVRKLIQARSLVDIRNPHTFRRTPTLETLRFWIDQFCTLTVHDSEISADQIVKSFINTYNQNIVHIKLGRLNQLKSPTTVISYKNSYTQQIFKHIQLELGDDFFMQNRVESQSVLNLTTIPCFYTHSGSVVKNYDFVKKFIKSNNFYSQLNPPFTVGSFIKCKKNDKKQGCYNGKTGILISLKFNQQPCGVSCESIADAADRYIFGKCCTDNIPILLMEYYDLDPKAVKSYKSVVESYCSSCGSKDCSHDSARVEFSCFHWYPLYISTLHSLQGSTIYEPIYLITDQVLKLNVVQSIYIILSRCNTAKQINIDKNFITRALHKIHNYPTSYVMFLKKYNSIIDEFLKAKIIH